MKVLHTVGIVRVYMEHRTSQTKTEDFIASVTCNSKCLLNNWDCDVKVRITLTRKNDEWNKKSQVCIIEDNEFICVVCIEILPF